MKSAVELAAILAQYEDVDSAIAVYKEANAVISQFEEIKKAALSLAEACLRSTGEAAQKTAIGLCGWTQPKAKKLDEDAWKKAVNTNVELSVIQAAFDRVKLDLENAQEPFMILPEGRFFIR